MKDLMIDLETFGRSADAVVLSIGACFFDTETLELGPQYYARLEIETQILSGRSILPATVDFWSNASPEARRIFKEPTSDTLTTVGQFVEWVMEHASDPLYVWGNGPTFDIAILDDLIKQCGFELPWKFPHVQDLRTFRRFVANNQPIPRLGTHHNALDDARDQAKFVIDQLRKRNEK